MADGEEQGQGGGQQVPAGWYPDPTTGGQRYWDGTQWTEYTDQNYPGQPAGAPAQPAAAAPAGATNQKAVWSLILGIVSIVCCFVAFGVLALGAGIAAVLLSRSAKREIAATGQTGEGMATAGMVCGILGVILGLIGLVLSIILIAIGEFSFFFDPGSFEEFNFDNFGS